MAVAEGGGGGGLGSGRPRGESSSTSTFAEQFVAEHHDDFEHRNRRKSGHKIKCKPRQIHD